MVQVGVNDIKRAVVLSDNDLLFTAIKVNLNRRLDVQVVEPCSVLAHRWYGPEEPNHLDLIVVAISGQCGEPVLALARASLAAQIGQVPILIISDRPFESRPEDSVAHLGFPFQPDDLQQRVQELLRRE